MTNPLVSTPIDAASAPRVASPAGVRVAPSAGLLTGLLLLMFLSALDQTIVAIALPRIAADLDGMSLYAWVFGAYALASTCLTPFYGALSDRIGRARVLRFGAWLFLVGSVLCGAATSMRGLIAFRAVQGIGAGALWPVAVAAFGDIFPPRERARWQALGMAVWAVAGVVGPLAGGLLTDWLSWRSIFLVNIPFGLAGALLLRRAKLRDAEERLTLRLAARALVPVSTAILCARDFAVSALIVSLVSASMYAGVLYVPLYFCVVAGDSTTRGGATVMPLLIALVVGALVGGRLVARYGRCRPIVMVGGALMAAGMVALVVGGEARSGGAMVGALIVVGLGLGAGLPVHTLVVQNAFPERIGEVTSALHFIRSLGGAAGASAMGWFLSGATDSAQRLLNRGRGGEGLFDGATVTAVATELNHVFECACVLTFVGCVATLLMRDVRLPKRSRLEAQSTAMDNA